MYHDTCGRNLDQELHGLCFEGVRHKRFRGQEQENIFSKVWVPMCHISEMRNKGDYRTTQIAGKRVIAINI